MLGRCRLCLTTVYYQHEPSRPVPFSPFPLCISLNHKIKLTYDSWTRNSIILKIRINIHRVPRLIPLYKTRDRDQRPGSSTTSVGYCYLGAGNVELRDSGGIGVVDSELLDAEEVITRWEGGGDGAGVCLGKGPDGVARAVEGWTEIEGFEPDAAGAVE